MRLLTYRYPVKDKETGNIKSYLPVAFFTNASVGWSEMKANYPALKVAEPVGDYTIDIGANEVPEDTLLTYKATKEMHDAFKNINNEFEKFVEQLGKKEVLIQARDKAEAKCKSLEKLIQEHYTASSSTVIEKPPVNVPTEINKKEAAKVLPPRVPKLNEIVMEDGTGVRENPPNIFEGTAKPGLKGDPF